MKRREVISGSSDIAISQTASSREQGRSQAHRVPEWPKHIAGEATGAAGGVTIVAHETLGRSTPAAESSHCSPRLLRSHKHALYRLVHRGHVPVERTALARGLGRSPPPGRYARAHAGANRRFRELAVALPGGPAGGRRRRGHSGRGVDTPGARPVGWHSRSDEARLPDAERLVQGPRHDRDGHLSEEAWRRRRAGGF